ncbi:MAG: DUF2163 domain-containing protein [Rhizobiaceae bacterium]|nr:DUF2163 domain-containing protein [Rhizobiaceae bacterium]
MTFENHLAGTATTLCYCWRLTRRDGTVMGFADHDRALTVDGTLFEPEAGFSASEARSALGLGIDSAEVDGALSSDKITDADISDGLYDGAEVETLIVNWREPAQFAAIARATIARITRSDGRFIAELEGPGRGLDFVRGRYIHRHCSAELGDERCGVNLAQSQFSGTGELVSQSGTDRLVVTGVEGFAQGWFANGVLTWTTGARSGKTERVVDFRHDAAGTVIVIWQAASVQPAPGDQFTIVAGCDKRFATCKAKFANSLNFRGFPHLPGNDSAYSYVTADGEFDGGPLVP